MVTGPFAYVRLLGDREAVDALTPTLDHIVLDRSAEVAADAKAIRRLREHMARSFVSRSKPWVAAARRETVFAFTPWMD